MCVDGRQSATARRMCLGIAALTAGTKLTLHAARTSRHEGDGVIRARPRGGTVMHAPITNDAADANYELRASSVATLPERRTIAPTRRGA